jgi:hypothetical protein
MEYEVRESVRAKRLHLSVYPDGRVVVTKPKRVSRSKALAFADEKRAWVEGVQRRLACAAEAGKSKPLPKLARGSKEHVAAVAAARTLIRERLAHVNAHYGFRYGRVSVRSQKTLWGSCSRRGNLNFNYKLVHLPLPVVDYLIAHELCHLKEPNHSARFWSLVAETCPDYLARRKELRQYIL